jgi:hypothetical protein
MITHSSSASAPSTTIASFNGELMDGLIGSTSLGISESDVSQGNKPLTDTLHEHDISPTGFEATKVYSPACLGNASSTMRMTLPESSTDT